MIIGEMRRRRRGGGPGFSSVVMILFSTHERRFPWSLDTDEKAS